MSAKKLLPILALSAMATACKQQTESGFVAVNPDVSADLRLAERIDDIQDHARPVRSPLLQQAIEQMDTPRVVGNLKDNLATHQIVGGNTTSDYAEVGAIALTFRGEIFASFCSGTLIDEEWVLTAAHCVDSMDRYAAAGLDDFEFVIGTHIRTPETVSQQIVVAERISHPDYNPSNLDNDVALLRLADPVEVVAPAVLAQNVQLGDFFRQGIDYVGWGQADDSSLDTSGTKRAVHVPTLEVEPLRILTYSEGQNVCYGDSGGAAFLTDETGERRLAGVNSYGFTLSGDDFTCEATDAGGASARVDIYIDWIATYVDIDVEDADADADADLSWINVSAGAFHTCGVATTSIVECWGYDNYGQSSPPSGSFASVSSGTYNSCGVTTSGTVECWGDDDDGQSSPPSDIFDSVSTGGAHSCGVTTSGTVECWGRDDHGQSSPPSDIFDSVSTGGTHSCGVTTSGTVECWGRGSAARPPSGTFDMVSTGTNHTCGVTTSGTVECWGSGRSGESTPPAGTFVTVSAGASHTCGVTTEGSVACWGNDIYGQSSPPSGTFATVSAGGTHTCGVSPSGSAECWGNNFFGQSDVVSTPGGTDPDVDCRELDPETCATDARCATIDGQVVYDDGDGGTCIDTSEDSVAVGCMDADALCTTAFTWAAPPGADAGGTECMMFSSGCIPLDWEVCGGEFDFEECMGASLISDRSGTLTVGETATLTVDGGGDDIWTVIWYQDSDFETVGGLPATEQQVRWSEPGTYTVDAQVFFVDGGVAFLPSLTFTVIDLGLDIGVVWCDDGGVGVDVMLTGTHDEGRYGIYGTSDLVNWIPLDIEIAGEEAETAWTNCDDPDRPSSFFLQATVEDNPDGDAWTTGYELLITDTDPWQYDEA